MAGTTTLDAIRERFRDQRLSIGEFATLIGQPYETASALLRGERRMTKQDAKDLAWGFETTPEYWEEMMERDGQFTPVVLRDPERLISRIDAIANELHTMSLLGGNERLRALADGLREALDEA
jgi:hypothetical protein